MPVRVDNSVSLDGYICGPNGYEEWISEADEAHFEAACAEADIIIMGSNTYGENSTLYPIKDKPNIVFTSQPKQDTSQTNLTFTDEDPVQFVKKHQGKHILVAGGGALNATLLKAGVITDVIVSIHPIILGSGIKQFADTDFNHHTALTKISQEDIGDGVVKIHYALIK